MERPLWQILFAMSLLAVAVARVATSFVLAGSELEIGPAVAASHALQALAALAAAIVIWVRREWTLAAFLGMGVVFAGSLLVPYAIA